jgi:type II secretory pathway pseudopilin PulG
MSRRAHGYTLIGLLATMILLGSFLLLASEAFVGATQIQKDLRRLDTGSGQIASALHGLRDAVWSAKQVTVVDPQTVDLDGVRWRWAEASGESGDSSAGRLHVGDHAGTPVPLIMTFAPHPAGLLVRVGGSPTVLPSQWMLARGEPQ